MLPLAKSIRPFIGSRDFNISREFYTTIGFTENVIAPAMSVFSIGNFSFYLQDAYVKEWVDNSMIFLEIESLDNYQAHLKSLDLSKAFAGVKLSKIVTQDWGREFFLHDPSGILWHIGSFKNY